MEVQSVELTPAVRIKVNDGSEFVFETQFQISQPGGDIEVNPDRLTEQAANAVKALIGRILDGYAIDEEATRLIVDFSGNLRIVADASDSYESWHVLDAERHERIALPGGGIATFG